MFVKKILMLAGLFFYSSQQVCPMQPSNMMTRFFDNVPGASFVAGHGYLVGLSAATIFIAALPGPRKKASYVLGHVLQQIGILSNIGVLEDTGYRLKGFEFYNPEKDPEVQSYTPLHSAVWKKNVPLVKQFLQEGADLEATTIIYCQTPIHLAACSDENDYCVDILIKAGAILDAYDVNGWLPIHWAAMGGGIDRIKLLGRSGDVQARTRNGSDLVFMATDYKDYKKDVAECIQSMEQHTKELMVAIDKQDVPRALWAIAAGAIVVRKDQDGATPLHKVVGHYVKQEPTKLDEIAKLIVHAIGRQIRKLRNTQEQTPLHIAAMLGNVRLMRLLLRNGSDVNAQDIHGNTPSHYASDLSTTCLLLRNAADLSICNNTGDVPVQAIVMLSQQ